MACCFRSHRPMGTSRMQDFISIPKPTKGGYLMRGKRQLLFAAVAISAFWMLSNAAYAGFPGGTLPSCALPGGKPSNTTLQINGTLAVEVVTGSDADFTTRLSARHGALNFLRRHLTTNLTGLRN